MNQNKDYGKWSINPAPGSGAEGPKSAVVLCSGCGRDIDPDEDCLDRWEDPYAEGIEELSIFLCFQCYKEGKG